MTQSPGSNLRLSVVIPVFNAETTVAEAVESAWLSGADEVIVVDDGSVDDSHSVIQGLQCKHLQQVNRGALAARLAGFDASSGEAIIFLDADDRLCARGVRSGLGLLADVGPDVGVVVGLMGYRRRDGYVRRREQPMSTITTTSLLQEGYTPAPPGAIIFRRHTINALRTHEIEWLCTTQAEDYETLLRATLVTNVALTNYLTLEYDPSGGKSLNWAGPQSVDAIRHHYGSRLGMECQHRSWLKRLQIMLIRVSMAEWGRGNNLRCLSFRLGAALVNPKLALTYFLGKLVNAGFGSHDFDRTKTLGQRAKEQSKQRVC